MCRAVLVGLSEHPLVHLPRNRWRPSPQDQTKCLLEAFDGYLQKPMTLERYLSSPQPQA